MRPQPVDVTGGVDLGARGHVGRVGGLAARRALRGWTLTSSPRKYSFTVVESRLALQRAGRSGGAGPSRSPCRPRRGSRGGPWARTTSGMSNGAPGQAQAAAGSSSVRNASIGRHWVVPWTRMPAVLVHQRLGPRPAVGQVDEGLSGEEVVAHIGHDALDPWLVGRGRHPGGVDRRSPSTGRTRRTRR